jgi:hypothetical protein
LAFAFVPANTTSQKQNASSFSILTVYLKGIKMDDYDNVDDIDRQRIVRRPMYGGDFSWVINQLKYKGFTRDMDLYNPDFKIPRSIIEEHWANMCREKLGWKQRVEATKKRTSQTDSGFQEASALLLKALKQIEGEEGFNINDYWHRQATYAKLNYNTPLDIEVSFLLP